jgi:peptidoglycan/xylan/chitin deacetylase (PgdA/CDA1 family)
LNTATAGNTFYYCVVTNTDTTATGNQTANATSRVGQVVVRRDAQTPNIVSTSPANMSVYQNSSSSITVAAYIDSGVLTYQWYTDTTGLNSGGTPVGSSSTSPTLTLNTSTAGTSYYYCVVTNTDYAAPGLKTATATSRAARVIVSKSTKGTLLLTFDDGWQDQYTQARPILEAKGFKATAYVNSDFIGQEYGYMSLSQAQALYAAGWDIANHTSTHEDEGVGDQTDQSHLAQLKAMYNDCATWLTSNGMPRAAYHVAYPSGKYTSDLIRLLKLNGFKTGRATVFGLQSAIQDQNDYFNLPVYSLGDIYDLAARLDGIDQAANTGTTLIIMIHKVERDPGDLVTLTSWLQDVVNRAKTQVDANKLQVMTISEWFEAQGVVGAGQTPPAPSVTGNDADNTVSGLNQVMEYKLDNAPGYTMYDPSTFTISLAGDHTLAVRYAAAGADPAGPDTVLTFTKVLQNITISPPTKTAYVEGTVFDPTGMVVTAHYDDASTAVVTGYTTDPSRELATTDKKVTISYTSAGITKTIDQPITVNAKKLSSIEITTEPTNKTYVEGTLFDPAGMVVTAYYDNGKHEVVTGYTIDPTRELAVTDSKVTVSYVYEGVTKTAEQTIVVNGYETDG